MRGRWIYHVEPYCTSNTVSAGSIRYLDVANVHFQSQRTYRCHPIVQAQWSPSSASPAASAVLSGYLCCSLRWVGYWPSALQVSSHAVSRVSSTREPREAMAWTCYTIHTLALNLLRKDILATSRLRADVFQLCAVHVLVSEGSVWKRTEVWLPSGSLHRALWTGRREAELRC